MFEATVPICLSVQEFILYVMNYIMNCIMNCIMNSWSVSVSHWLNSLSVLLESIIVDIL